MSFGRYVILSEKNLPLCHSALDAESGTLPWIPARRPG